MAHSVKTGSRYRVDLGIVLEIRKEDLNFYLGLKTILNEGLTLLWRPRNRWTLILC